MNKLSKVWQNEKWFNLCQNDKDIMILVIYTLWDNQ